MEFAAPERPKEKNCEFIDKLIDMMDVHIKTFLEIWGVHTLD